MALKITHLSVSLSIGGNSISLKSEGLPNLSKQVDLAKDEIRRRMKDGLSFHMDPGQHITTSVGDIISWLNDKLDHRGIQMPDFLKHLSGTEGDEKSHQTMPIELWGLSISTKRNISFNIKVTMTKELYESIGIPEAVSKIFSPDNFGIGLAYDPEPV